MKIKTLLSKITFFCCFVFILSSCLKDDVEVDRYYYSDEEFALIQNSNLDLPRDLIDYKVNLPTHMKNMGVTSPNISNSKAALGRVLFYDKKLSKNNSVSCASCHKQELAFSDDVALSEGFDGELTLRNSLPLASTVNFKSSYDGGSGSFGRSALFFWDERASTIEEQSSLTIEDNIEMGMDLDELTVRLNEDPVYQLLFRKAYGDETATKQRILNAISQFVNSFVSVDSKFDQGMARHHSEFTEFNNFTESENRGKALFVENCSSCHGSDHTRLQETTANNGLDAVYEDHGVGGITGFTGDVGKFKVPFLRNVELTAPYMHDGRFTTLEEVVEHYSTGIKLSDNLDFRLRDFDNFEDAKRMNFTTEQKEDLVAFLKTLTDYTFTADTKFSDPFN